MDSATLLLGKRFVATAIVFALIIGFPLSALIIGEAAAPTTHEVKITDFAFVPQNLTINLGDTVMWNNTDPVIHTLWFVYVANGSTYLLSDPILPDTTWSYTFNDAVELQYYDFNRLWITGFITVQAEVHDVAVTDVVRWKTVVGQGFKCQVKVTVANKGNFTETFDVTLNASTAVIETKTVNNLPPETSTSLTFIWDTTGWPKGNYTLIAHAPMPDDARPNDNLLEDGWVIVAMVGDITGTTPCVPDGIVDIFDLVACATHFGHLPPDGHSPGTLPYNMCFKADINGDGIVDIFDIVIIATRYGQIDP